MAKRKATKKTAKKTAVKKRKPVDHVKVEPSRCKQCGSTDRSRYYDSRSSPHYRKDPETGKETTHRVWRRCKCESCGQMRVDISDENRSNTTA